jgi:hypothetical protein
VKVTDASNPPTATLTATLNVNVVVPDVAVNYAISLVPTATPGGQSFLPGPISGVPNVPTGTPVTVAVVALDAQNRPDFDYHGTANVVVTDGKATYSPTVTFQDGFATFKVTFATAGAQMVTVTDPNNKPALKATLNVNVVDASLVAKYNIQLVPPANGGPIQVPPSATGVPNVPENQPIAITVTALNALNQPLTGYTGPANVWITGTAATITYPESVTFTNGVANLDPTFVTVGQQTVTVTDASIPSATSTLKVNVVVPAAVTHFGVYLPPMVAPGQTVTAELMALNAQNQPVPGYSGTVDVTSSDGKATYLKTVNFTDGTAPLAISFATPGQQSVTVTDPQNGWTGVGYTMVLPPLAGAMSALKKS